MSGAFARFDAFPHWPLETWQPSFPPGRIERIYLHWSAGDYETAYTAYHYCVATHDGRIYVVQTNDLRANMRDVYAGDDTPYTAHTYRRNSYAAGIAVLAMQGARPDDFGAYPLTDANVNALCLVAARLALAYGIPIDGAHVMTHAEAAIEDGYFGSEDDELRWDLALLEPLTGSLTDGDARINGDALRAKFLA